MDLESAVKQVLGAALEAKEAAKEATTAAHGATAAANASAKAVHELGRGQAVLRRDLQLLWTRVHGSEVPYPAPPDPGVDVSLEPVPHWSDPPVMVMAERAAAGASATSLDLAELEGQVLAIRTELSKQSTAMGLGKAGLEYFMSKAGQRSILRVIGAIGAVVAGIGAIVAACSRPPLPVSAPVAPTMIVLTAPAPVAFDASAPIGVSPP